ncbi:MAG: RNA polymerase sigma factor [Longimicrobiales bacterium]
MSREIAGRAASSDAELVEEVREGIVEAFEALVRRYLRAAHRLAMSIVADADEADDIVQDGFILALRRIHQLREPAAFRNWLLSIVRNRAINIRAAAARRAEPGLEETRVASGLAGPDAELERAELEKEVQRAAEGLTRMQRRVFLLHDIEGKNHGEIAESLGISRGSSRVHLHMARRGVQSRLIGHYSKDMP